eukprot:4200193-Pleurochrysis_carterae.AAC.1
MARATAATHRTSLQMLRFLAMPCLASSFAFETLHDVSSARLHHGLLPGTLELQLLDIHGKIVYASVLTQLHPFAEDATIQHVGEVSEQVNGKSKLGIYRASVPSGGFVSVGIDCQEDTFQAVTQSCEVDIVLHTNVDAATYSWTGFSSAGLKQGNSQRKQSGESPSNFGESRPDKAANFHLVKTDAPQAEETVAHESLLWYQHRHAILSYTMLSVS